MTADTGAEWLDARAAELDKPETDAQAFDRLAKLPPVDYDRCRQAEAERMGIRVGTLDAEAERQRTPENGTETGASVLFDEPEPWPEAVDGAALLDTLADTFNRHVILPEHAAVALTLWTVNTYAFDAAVVCPILAATSPEKRCGKTTVLILLNRLAHKPLPTANITAAALFRTVEKWQPTLLIDEADTFLRSSDELRGVINSGHTRDTAYVIRTVGEDHEPRHFMTWCPKAIAAIGTLADTVSDRAIIIPLRRKLASESTEKLRKNGALLELRRRCLRWANDHYPTLQGVEPEIPDGLNDRAADNWAPLLAIADAAGGQWPEQARTAALILSGDAAAGDASLRTQLLADIRGIFETRGQQRIASTELVEYLAVMEDRPWPEWKQGKPITPRQLARLLHPFGIEPKLYRFEIKPGRGYDIDQFHDTFARYLPTPSVTPLQANDGAAFSGFQSVTSPALVTEKKRRNPHCRAVVTV